MQELEVKILDIDRAACEKILDELHSKKIFDGILEARFYDYPDHRIQLSKGLLRLRSDGKKHTLTFKQHPKGKEDKHLKIRQEYEIIVSDFETAHQFLLALGLECTLFIRKHRTSYRLGDSEVEIDEHLDDYAGIPVFMEIEAPSKPILLETVTRFGYTLDDCKPWSFFDLIKHYQIKV